LLTITLSAALAEEGGSSDHQWTMGGQNLRNWRNQDNSGINPHTVVNLKTKWIFTTGGDVSATPAVVNGVVYFPDFAGNFYVVNAKTGALVWTRKVSDWTGIAGDYARNDPLVYGDRVILGDQPGRIALWNGSQLKGAGARVMAVNANTGKLIWVTTVETFPTALVTSSPVVFDGIVYVGVSSSEEELAVTQGYPCCVSRGSLVALDVQTGKKLWQTYLVPDNHGLPGGYSGGGIWDTTPVIDPKRNSVYVGTGNNYSVPVAVEACNKATPANKYCTDPTDYFDSVVALDLKTGKVKWANRAIVYDAWNVACLIVPAGVGNCPSPEGPDFDFGGTGPNLFTVATDRDHAGDGRGEKNGRDILGIGEKSGIYWALNPDDGSVIWKTLVGPGSALSASSGAPQPTATAYTFRSPICSAFLTHSNLPAPCQQRLVGRARSGDWQGIVADCNAGKVFDADQRRRSGLHGARTGERCQRGCLCWFDGSQSRQSHNVRPGRKDRKHPLVVCCRKFGHRRPGDRRKLHLLGLRLPPPQLPRADHWYAQQQAVHVLNRR
jgi:outer membrane protein assembly factor BamB